MISFLVLVKKSCTFVNSLVTSALNYRYVAPEYANTGLLNEKSDIYSFGVLLLEAVTGRDPVDYARPANEVPNPYERLDEYGRDYNELLMSFNFTA